MGVSMRSLFLAILCCGGLLVVGCACMGIQSKLANAVTAREEAEAFRTIWNCSLSYTIDFLDDEGRSLGADYGPDHSSVRAIEIKWPSGKKIRHRIIDASNIQLLLRQ